MGTLRWIRACWQCDGCGKDFIVEIDSAWKPPADWDTTTMAEDAIRHGEQVSMKGHMTTHSGLIGSCSVQHDLALCGDCTRIADSIGDDNYRPSRDEILREIGAI